MSGARPTGLEGFALRRADLDPNPYVQLRAWMREAEEVGVPEPTATTLATVDEECRPSVRAVLLKEVRDGEGLVFYTNYQSRKARQLDANPWCALELLWTPCLRQVSVEGRTRRLPHEEAEAYFATRPRESQLGAWASAQSEPIASRAELDARYAEVEKRFRDRDVPCPPHWGGYLVEPTSFQFWQARPGRMHDRFRYAPTPAGGWSITRLQP